MKKDENMTRICPVCGQGYTGRPALSRENNLTAICPECGTRQALDSIGVCASEQEEIIRIIRRNYSR